MKTLIIFLLIIFSISLVPHAAIAQTNSPEVGFILANLFMERWNKDKQYFEKRFAELGGKVTFVDCYDQPENQINAAKDLIQKEVDAIIIIAVDAVAAAPVVTMSKEAGIPVIAYDRLILDAPLDYYITFNSIAIGEMMANAVTKKIEKGNILYIGGPSGDYNSLLIRQGVFKVLNQAKEYYTVHSKKVSSWSELDSYLKIQDYFSNTEQIPDAIICAADVLTYGAIAVLEENNLLGKVILTGQDAELNICRYIAKDIVELTIYKPGEMLAERTANEVWKLLQNKTIKISETINNGSTDVPAIYLDPIPVTKKTLDKTVINENYFTHDQIYGTGE